MTGLSVALDATPLLGERTGVGEFCAGALRALALRGDVEVSAFAVSWRRRGGIVAELPLGVRALLRPLPARPVHAAWKRGPFPPAEWVTGEVDVVHGTNFVVPPTRRAARVVTVHDLTTIRFPELCEAETLEFPGFVRRAISDGAFVHTPSRFVAGEVVEHLGADPSRVRAVAHGLPVAPVAPGAARREARPVTPPYLLAVGTVEPRKDLPTLVSAFDILAARTSDLRLVIAGRDGWGTAALEEALESCAARGRVSRRGYVSAAERDSLLAGATIFCFPSLYEGFGLPPLEAMAAGVPVVATAAGALPEVLGDAAALVAPKDADALAAAIELLLGDDSRRRALIEAGKRRVARFTWDACAAGLVELYHEARQASDARRGRTRGHAPGSRCADSAASR